MKKKDTFKIGELSKLFDIGVDSIRYYEKVGILHPVRNDENNYRMYTIDDVRRLALIRELLGLSFSTDQIHEYDEDRNVKSTTELLQTELEVVDSEIAKLRATRGSIQNRLDTITSLGNMVSQDTFEKVLIKEFPDRGCVMVTDDNLPAAIPSQNTTAQKTCSSMLHMLRKRNAITPFHRADISP